MSGKATKEPPLGRKEAAAYIFEMTTGLSKVARQADLMFLAYLLEITGDEAARAAGGDGPAVPRGPGGAED